LHILDGLLKLLLQLAVSVLLFFGYSLVFLRDVSLLLLQIPASAL